ncbi:FCD domain-containing protein [Litorivicinus lipolyticus]|uniref:FCD domain-containing protein n=2 Tax=Litorivicinus lipolyticus TaxID=418701 RepID=A0A5Q2Q7L0_9GAMM|nr:FCD domain-containing protein [Litorivicinus lipolyticus]
MESCGPSIEIQIICNKFSNLYVNILAIGRAACFEALFWYSIGGLMGGLASLGLRARNMIEALIIDGAITTGEKVTERDLAERLGMSRAPIRDAIKDLLADGLLQRLSARSIVVRDLQLSEVGEIYEIRSMLEGRAAYLAATRLSADGLQGLTELHEQMCAASDRQMFSEYYQLNIQFHRAIHRASASPRLVSMIETVMKESLLFRSRGLVDAANLGESSAEHAMILRALNHQDPDLAGLLMDRHIRGGLARLRLT